MSHLRWFIAVVLLPLVAGAAETANASDDVPVITDPARAWESIERYFQPPVAYRYDFGLYRSPLLAEDGSRVTTPADWERRRREILAAWHRIMGPWPPLIDSPAVEIQSSEKRAGFTRHRVKVELHPGRTSDGYLLVPEGDGPFPAVVVVFYEPETSIGEKRDYLAFGLHLARRGYVTLQLNPLQLADDEQARTGLQRLSHLACQAANSYNAVASLPYVDPRRVGIIGHSFGGKWAMFAACLYDKFAAGVWVAPGIVFDESEGNSNYWTGSYLGGHESAYMKLKEEGRDLLELQSLMAPRPFFVSAGSPDHDPALWRMLNHLVKLNRLLGYKNRVGMSNRPPHSPTLADGEDIYRFFDVFLKHERIDRVEPSSPMFSAAELAAPLLAVIPDDRMSKYIDRNKNFTDYDLLLSFELLPADAGPTDPEAIDLGLYYRAVSPENGLKMLFARPGGGDSPGARWELLKIREGLAEPMTDPIRREPAVLPSPIREGVRYWLRFKLTWSHTAAKVWPQDRPEPLEWPLVAEDLDFTGGLLMLQYRPDRVRYDRLLMNGEVVPLNSIVPYGGG